jgi:hypothetical protein
MPLDWIDVATWPVNAVRNGVATEYGAAYAPAHQIRAAPRTARIE